MTSLFPVTIDFNQAQIAWRANKTYLGNGYFKYKVSYPKISSHRYYLRSTVKSKSTIKKNITTHTHNYNLRPRKQKTYC